MNRLPNKLWNMVESGPEMGMEPVAGETERRITLEQAMNTTARSESEATQVAGLMREGLERYGIYFARR